MKCRTCGSDNVRRSRMRNLREETVVRLTPFRYYRCHDCNDRMLSRGRTAPPKRRPVSRSRARRVAMRYLKVIVVLLALAAGTYFVLAPYFDLARPTSAKRK